ncbi:MAG: response regulator [Desulfococcaceae bacterium]
MCITMELFAELRNKNILLVDDDEWIRDSLCIFFETGGCSLKAVESAEAGMNEIGRQNYDIMITDYQLPGMSGLDLLRQIHCMYPHMLTILISAYGNHDIYAQAAEIGVENIIEKPFSTGTIKASLSRIICEQKGEPYDDNRQGEVV